MEVKIGISDSPRELAEHVATHETVSSAGKASENGIRLETQADIGVDVRIVVNFAPQPQRYRPSQEDILRAMRRIMQPDADGRLKPCANDTEFELTLCS